MNITIKIIWIEDADEWYESTHDYIVSQARLNGVELIIERQRNGDNIEEIMSKGEVDIALVDHKLRHSQSGDSTTGDVIAQMLASRRIAHSIIYYSEYPQGMNRDILRPNSPIKCVTRRQLTESCLDCIDAIIERYNLQSPSPE